MYEQTSMIAPPQAEAKPAARYYEINEDTARKDRKSTRLNSSHCSRSRMPSSA